MSRAVAAGALEFLGRVLETQALEVEYPLVFGEGTEGETLELVEEGEVRAACALLVREFQVGPHRLRGGLIGSVATDPAHRRQGLATRLLERAEAELRLRGCLFALLWAEEPRFYLKRGYEPFGCEHNYLLTSELVGTLPASTGVRVLREGDEAFLHRLQTRHGSRVERTREETRKLLALPGMLTLVRERSAAPGHPAQPVAYSCLGRGRDLTDVIHDWAGETEDVLAVLRGHLERRFPAGETGALFLMAPPSATELGYRLATLGAVSSRGILGLGKLLDLGASAELLRTVLGDPEAAEWDGKWLALNGPLERAELNGEGVQALLFGGSEVRKEAQALLERLGFKGVRLPLEPFAFGLDSI